jgi:hypothetical protein
VKNSINGASTRALQQRGSAPVHGFVTHVSFNDHDTQGDFCSSYDPYDRRNSDFIPWVDLNIPKFFGREDPKAYLVWEEKCDYIFGVHRVLDTQRVHLAAMEFYGYALTWWKDVQENQLVLGRDHINTWAEMKQVMRRRFVPSDYHHKQQQRSLEIDNTSVRNSSTAALRYSAKQGTFQLVDTRECASLKEKRHSGQRQKMHDAKVLKQNDKKVDCGLYKSRNRPSKFAHMQHIPHVEIAADGYDGNVVPFFLEDDLIPNPCEKESHKAKLNVRVKKKTLSDSTISRESHIILCGENTQTLSEIENRPCEEIFISNMTISSSLFSHEIQVAEENDVVNYDKPPIFDEEDQEMDSESDTRHDILMLPHHEDSYTCPEPLLYLATPAEMDNGGNNSEMPNMVQTQSLELTGITNGPGMNFNDKHSAQFDDICAIILVDHSKKIVAELIEPHADTNVEIDLDTTICTLIDPCNTLHTNKCHSVQLITSAELFEKGSPANCLFYTKFDMLIHVNKMLENISMVTSSSSLNNAHSCKFTFILIGEHVINNFYVHSICITNDMIADWCHHSCDMYFSDDVMNQLLSACYLEPSISSPCSYIPLEETSAMQKCAICALEKHLSTSMSIAFEGSISQPMNDLCNKNCWSVLGIYSPCAEQYHLGMVKLEMLNKLCCVTEIFVLPFHNLFVGKQMSMMLFHRGKMKFVAIMFQVNSLLQYNRKSRSTFFQGRGDDAHILMIVKYSQPACCFENSVMENNKNDKTDDIFIYHAYIFFLLYILYSGFKKFGITFLQDEENDADHICTLGIIIVKRICKVKAILNFNPSYFHMAKLLLGLYDYRSKHLGILEEIHAIVPTKLDCYHFNHERVIESPSTIFEDGDQSPFFEQEESGTTRFQEGEDDVHMSSLRYAIESRTTPSLSYAIESRTTSCQEGEDDMHTPASSTTPTTLPTSSTTLPTSTPTPTGPITRSRAKKIQQEVHALLCELKLNSNDNFMLPKSCMLILLRYMEESHQDEDHEAEIGKNPRHSAMPFGNDSSAKVIRQGHSAVS